MNVSCLLRLHTKIIGQLKKRIDARRLSGGVGKTTMQHLHCCLASERFSVLTSFKNYVVQQHMYCNQPNRSTAYDVKNYIRPLQLDSRKIDPIGLKKS